MAMAHSTPVHRGPRVSEVMRSLATTMRRPRL